MTDAIDWTQDGVSLVENSTEPGGIVLNTAVMMAEPTVQVLGEDAKLAHAPGASADIGDVTAAQVNGRAGRRRPCGFTVALSD